MASQEVDSVINRLEKNMIRDYLISADFKSISKSQVNRKRRVRVILFNILIVISILEAAVGFLSDSKSKLHVYSLNVLYGYGYLGRLWNGAHVCAATAVMAHAVVFFINEGRGTLYPVIKLKEMYKKLDNPSSQETASFLYFLKIAVYVREICFMAVWTSMTSFRAIGTVITAYKLNSVSFFMASMIPNLIFMIVQQYCPQVHIYTHLLIAQSTTYFKLRLSRVEKSLENVVLFVRINASRFQRDGIKKKLVIKINKQLIVLDEILNEISAHNKYIKYWLRDELIITRGLLSYFLVSTVRDIEWYFKLSTLLTVVSWTGALGPSFINAALLYVRILSMARLLHACQNHVKYQSQVRSKSASVLRQNEVSPQDIMKTKYQLLRMIHRVSSPFLIVGYTEGDGISFSPASIGQFVSTVIFTSLMFLNSSTDL